jgi:hypothetical protein
MKVLLWEPGGGAQVEWSELAGFIYVSTLFSAAAVAAGLNCYSGLQLSTTSSKTVVPCQPLTHACWRKVTYNAKYRTSKQNIDNLLTFRLEQHSRS